MGLLDQDADELKKSAAQTDKPTSGRKVNRAGLGAFKGLSRINTLTSKYRQTNQDATVAATNSTNTSPDLSSASLPEEIMLRENVSVEQFRGTKFSTAAEVGTNLVRTQDNVESKLVQKFSDFVANELVLNENPIAAEVGTKLGHIVASAESLSQDEVSSKLDELGQGSILVDLKSVQTKDEVGTTLEHPEARVNDFASANIKSFANSEEKSSISEVGTNSGLSQNKLSTKKAQSRYKLNTREAPTQDEVSTNTAQKYLQTQYKVGSELSTKLIPLGQSLVPIESVFTLPKTQYAILEYMFQNCQWNGSLITTQITVKELVLKTQLIRDTVVTSIKRLRTKLFIDKESYKDGQAGWTIYRISEIAYREFVERNNNPVQRFEVSSQLSSNPSSKLVSNLNYTNLLTQNQQVPSDELDSVSFLNLSEVNITKSIINDIRKNKWGVTKYQLETHIERFSKWILMPDKFKNIQNPRAIFCNNIKSIFETGIDPLDWIKTEADVEMNQILAERKLQLEAKKRQIEELKNLDFEEWKLTLSRGEATKLVPENDFLKFGTEVFDHMLRDHYFSQVWKR